MSIAKLETSRPEMEPNRPADQGPAKRAWLWDLWVITVATAFGPAMVVINNPESPEPWTAVAIVVALVCLAALVRLALTRARLDPRGATYAVAVFMFVMLNSGFVVGSASRLEPLLLGIGFSLLAYRLRDVGIFKFLVSWACLALAVGPAVLWLSGRDSASAATAPIGEDIDVAPFTSTPDVVLVVADGYGSNQVLSEFYEYDNGVFAESMANAGSPLSDHMTSNYARTMLSIPSLLQLGYLPLGAATSGDFEAQLLSILGGENRLADTMRANGYRTVYVESGWTGTDCSELNDVCIPAPWPDETAYDIAYRSILRDAPGFETGMSFARGAKHVLGNLSDTLSTYLTDDRPDFIYVHILVPHPPLFLDENCELRANVANSGFAVGATWMSEAQLANNRDAYIDQVKCANKHLLEAAVIIDDVGAVGLFFGDHGPDQGAQLTTHSDTWDAEQKAERYNVLFAAHHEGCEYESVTSLVNVGRRLVACLSGSEVPSLADRYFDLDKHLEPPQVIELDPPRPAG